MAVRSEVTRGNGKAVEVEFARVLIGEYILVPNYFKW